MVRDPRHHVQRVAEHRGTRPRLNHLAVHRHRHGLCVKIGAAPIRDRLAFDPSSVNGVVRDQALGTDRGPVLESMIDDLDGWDHGRNELGNRFLRVGIVPVRHIGTDLETELGLDDTHGEVPGENRCRAAMRGG